MNRRRTERGLALVSVLWGVAILSLIAAAMLSASVISAHIDRNVWNAARGAGVADAAVAEAILSLLDDRAGHQPRTDGTPATFAFDGVAVRLRIQDESGKINLNAADGALLKSLFVSAGVTDEAAGALADRIVARRAMPALGGPVPLAFRAVDELLSVPGMSPALFARVAPALTVYGHGAALNQDVAPREALRALPRMDEAAIGELLRARDAAHAAADSQPSSAPPAAAGNAFMVAAELSVDGARTARVAVVQFTGDPSRPYLIMAWR